MTPRRPTTARAASARAFTMLEILLASVIGALVVITSLALFNSMDGMDRALARRADDTSELARLHLVMTRTFSSLVMSDQPPPRATTPASGATPSTTPTPTPTPTPSGGPTSTTRTPATGNEPPTPSDAVEKTPAPRFLIAPSPAPGLATAATPLQRLEVVIDKAPISDPRAPALPRARLTQTTTIATTSSTSSKPATDEAEDQEDAAAETAGDSAARAEQSETRTVETTGEAAGVRGYFELVPESALPGYAPPARAGDKQPLALIWRELPLSGQVVTTLPEPIVVARGLEAVRWLAFDDRERKDNFAATWSTNLPAYVEMEVRTLAGQYVNWMFEVEWSQGPEPGEPPASVTRGRTAVAGAGGGGPRGPGQGLAPGTNRTLRVPAGEAGRARVMVDMTPDAQASMRDAMRAMERPRDGRGQRGPRREFFPPNGQGPRDRFNPRDFPPPPPGSGPPPRQPGQRRPARPPQQGGPR